MMIILTWFLFEQKAGIVYIEEPELFIHPGLQRQLMDIYAKHPRSHNFQFFITTHSNHIVDFTRSYEGSQINSQIIRVQKILPPKGSRQEAQFHIQQQPRHDLTILNDLGVSISSVLLSNCIVWVEGPSEIYWLRAWIKTYLKLKHPDLHLIEGLHYSIMMTGGGLIARVEYTNDTYDLEAMELEAKIRVLRVNPHAVVIIDSDNASKGGKKENRSLRIAQQLHQQNKNLEYVRYNDKEAEITAIKQIEQLPNMWRFTAKELENYCHPELLKAFYTKLAKNNRSKVKLPEEREINWDVYSPDKGVGLLLSKQGVKGVTVPKSKSGAIKHKIALAEYVHQHFDTIHLEQSPSGIAKPNKKMIEEITTKLEKIISYIKDVNRMTNL